MGRKYIKLSSINAHISKDRRHLAAVRSRRESALEREQRRAIQNMELQQEDTSNLEIQNSTLHIPHIPANALHTSEPRFEPGADFWNNTDYAETVPAVETNDEYQLQAEVDRLLSGVNDDLVTSSLAMTGLDEGLNAEEDAERENERMLEDMIENAGELSPAWLHLLDVTLTGPIQS
ncbi:hypothetical protein VKT23_012664 [Stygiomarasmius scandens]|uniref:Uncharacterized protein n=1 Tax=Marasmiellus scandens TaxID=2682957 RepID=A0ABR1J6J0_9AGAR